MTTWFTSDTHFWHYNIIDFCNRPIPGWKAMSREEACDAMNWMLVTNINHRVQEDDELYILGDFAFCGRNNALLILDAIQCKKLYLIRGNHDNKLVKQIGHKFVWVRDYSLKRFDITTDKGTWSQPIIMCHFPIESWDGMAHGSWHLHGHCHGSMVDRGIKRLDVGVDPNNYYPLSLNDIADKMAKREFKAIDHHGTEERSYELRTARTDTTRD